MTIYGKSKAGEKIHIFTEAKECVCDLNIKMDKEVSEMYAEQFHPDKICISCKINTHAFDEKIIRTQEIIKRMGFCEECNTQITTKLLSVYDFNYFLNTNILKCPVCAKEIKMVIKNYV